MKKCFCILLVLFCCAALLAGCGPNQPQTPADTQPSETPAPAEAPDLEAVLKALAEQYPGDTARALAEHLLENPYFKLFVVEAQDVRNGEMPYFPALNQSFTGEGLKDSACAWDAFGSRAIVYVFTPEEGADAQAILDAAENAVDPYWSETPFDNRLSFASGGRAFFAMYNSGMQPVTGAVAEKARDFVEMFHAYLNDAPEAAAMETARYLTAHQKITAMRAEPAAPGRLLGFGDYEHENEVTGFAEGAGLIPEISPDPFIGYVFRLEDGADVDAFIKDLEQKANLAWNVCIVTDTVITEAHGNTVLFMMCSEGKDR